jgi:RND family efflux transporter MFP subunit
MILIALVALALIGGAGYFGFRSTQPSTVPTPSAPQTIPVTRGDVRQTVSAPGQLVTIRQADLALDTGGRLAEVAVRPGDRVRKGDVLARLLDDADVQVQVTQAEINLRLAELKLIELTGEADSAALASAEAQVTQAEINLRLAELKLVELTQEADPASLASAQASLASAQADLTNLLAPPTDQEVLAAQANLESAKENLAKVQAGTTTAQLAAAEATLKAAEDSYQRVIARPDPEDVQEAKLRLDQARNSLWSAQVQRDSIKGNPMSTGAARDSAEANVANAEVSVQLAELAYEQAQEPATAAEIEKAAAEVELARDDLERLRESPTASELASAQAQVAQAQAQLDALLADPDAQAVAAAEAKVAQAQAQLDALLAGASPEDRETAQLNVEQARSNLTQAQAQLDALLAGASPEDLETAQLNVEQARSNLTQAQAQLEDTVLTAPFDGVVLEVNAALGGRIAAGATLITLMGPTAVEAKVTVIEEDLPLIEVGQPVELFVDALPDASLHGHVARIIPQSVAGDSPRYPVYISLDDELPAALAPGMTVDASIITAERQDVLTLPRALVRARSDGTAQVKVWVAGRVEERTVRVGLRGDLRVEILEGLREGEQVVGK